MRRYSIVIDVIASKLYKNVSAEGNCHKQVNTMKILNVNWSKTQVNEKKIDHWKDFSSFLPLKWTWLSVNVSSFPDFYILLQLHTIFKICYM